MVKLSLALRVVALSALMLGAVLAEDAASEVRNDAGDAGDAVAQGQEIGQDVAPEDQAAAAADAKAEAAGKAAQGMDATEPAAGVDPTAAAVPAPGDAVAKPQDDGGKDAEDDDGDGTGDGLYFFVKKTGPMKCFVIDRAEKSYFHVHYDFPAAQESKEVRLELRSLPLQGPRKKRFEPRPVATKSIKAKHGSHQFYFETGGSHSLCAVTDSTHGVRGLRLSLDIEFGKINWSRAAKDDLDEMQIAMVNLWARAVGFVKEADYSKDLEKGYHKTILRLNREVLWWPISHVVMLLIMGFVQVRHLKRFFKNKRLV